MTFLVELVSYGMLVHRHLLQYVTILVFKWRVVGVKTIATPFSLATSMEA